MSLLPLLQEGILKLSDRSVRNGTAIQVVFKFRRAVMFMYERHISGRYVCFHPNYKSDEVLSDIASHFCSPTLVQ